MELREFRDKPLICLCSSDEKLEKLLENCNKISKGKNLVQIFKADQKLVDRLLPAYIMATLRHNEKAMKARNIQNELLLFVSGNMNVHKAIEICGAKSEKEFILFANNQKSFKEFSKISRLRIKSRYKVELKPQIAQKVAINGLLD